MVSHRIKKLILLRLLVGALLLYCPSVFKSQTVSFYGVSSLICLLSAAYVLWYLTRRWYRWLVITQIAADVVVGSYLVFVTGGAESLFATLYVPIILSAALVSGEKKTIVLTTVASSLSYFSVSLVEYQLAVNQFMPRDPIYFLYGTALRVAIFFTVGHLSRHLSGTIVELENKLKLSERLSFLGEVVSKISHEIRNPLSAVRTAAEVLRDSLKGKLSPQEEKMLVVIDGESDRMTKTFQRILNYAKSVQPNPKMLLVDTLIERTLPLVQLRSGLYSNGITVEKQYDAAKTHLYGDEEQVIAALLNLLLNAYDAMPQGGWLRIRAQEDLQGTRIDLQDSGAGIPPDRLKDLFVPFKSTKKGGTGLGLAEVHKIITLHEGRIDVESEQGKGTTFHLYFPKS